MENLAKPLYVPESFLSAPEGSGSASATAVCTAELAECACPDFCERDHTNE